MDCRSLLDRLTRLGSRVVESDPEALAHCQHCRQCAQAFKAEQKLDRLLAADFPELPHSTAAINKIMAAVACAVSDSTVLSYLDDSLEGRGRDQYESHRLSCAQCQSREASHNEVWRLLEHGFPAALAHNEAAVERCRRSIFGSKRRRKAVKHTSPAYGVYLKVAAAILIAFGLLAFAMKKSSDTEVAKSTPFVKDKAPKQDKDPEFIEFGPKSPKSERQKPLVVELPKDKPELDKVEPKKEFEAAKNKADQAKEPRFARKEAVKKEPLRTKEKRSQEEMLLASLSKEDRQLVKNMELLEEMEATKNLDKFVDSDLLTVMTLEDFE
jgi:hypothetical protein